LLPAERLACLRLIRSDKVGPLAFAGLLRRYGSAARALAEMPGLNPPPLDAIHREVAAAEACGARLLIKGDAHYPPLLARLDEAQPVLFARGDAALAARPAIAIVGARNASALGQRFAKQLAADLGAAGFVIVSGLARGIDAAAHRGSLASGTIAVLGTGIDMPFPPENESLYEDIAASGLILSQFPPGTPALPKNFPRRNAIIAGCALGTVVVEGAVRSGSLLTARLANEQGREVFAVPGSPLDPRAQGPNGLIKGGATLVEGAEDVLAVLNPMLARPGAQPAPAPTAMEADEPPPADIAALVLSLLSPSPVALDDLVRQSDCPATQVAAALLDLELTGQVMRHPGGKVARA
jgi:DNA processing protein